MQIVKIWTENAENAYIIKNYSSANISTGPINPEDMRGESLVK